MKRILDLNFPCLNLDGEPYTMKSKESKEPETVGRFIANFLVQSPKGDVLKHYDWALALNKGKPIELDESDWNTFKEWLKTHETMIPLFKAPAYRAMLDAEKDREKDNGAPNRSASFEAEKPATI